jgi:hypothetical protein
MYQPGIASTSAFAFFNSMYLFLIFVFLPVQFTRLVEGKLYVYAYYANHRVLLASTPTGMSKKSRNIYNTVAMKKESTLRIPVPSIKSKK